MKRIGLFLLAVVMVAGMVGCGGGGDDDDNFDFNGKWLASYTTIQSDLPSVPVGTQSVGSLRITQSGTAIVVQGGTAPPISGTCDPKARTFVAQGVTASGVIQTVTGQAVDEDTIAGELRLQSGPYSIREAYTAQLESRTLSASKNAESAPVGDAIEDVYRAIH